MKTKELLNVVNQTMSGCKTNEEGHRNLLFKDGYVYAWSSALSVSAKQPAGCDLNGIVDGVALSLFLSRLVREDVEITSEEGRWHFTAGAAEADMATKTDEQLERSIAKRNEMGLEWKTLPENFYECLSICDIPNNMYVKAGVFIKDSLMVSTDNKRVNRATLKGKFDSAVLMAPYSVSEILRLGLKFTEYAVTDRWVNFRTTAEGTELLTFSCNRLGDETNYPYDKYVGLISKAMEGTLVNGKFPKLGQALVLAQCFDESVKGTNDTMNNVISVKFDKTKLTIFSERGTNGSLGRYRETFAYPDKATLAIESPVTVRLSAPFLLSALHHTQDFRLSYVGSRALLVLNGEFFDTVLQVLGG